MNDYSLDDAPRNDLREGVARPQNGELHLWSWPALGASPKAEELACLDAGEQERYERFVDDQIRQKFLAAHAGLRRLLAAYLDCEPSDVEFATDVGGKPRLASDPFQFNLSHSGVWVVAAVSQGAVGMDVERIRPVTKLGRLAAKHMTITEQAAIACERPRDQTNAFFRLWTRKEAVVKLTGLGLRAGVSQLEVSPAAQFAGEVSLPDNWKTNLQKGWLASIDMPKGYVAAVACERPPSEIVCRQP